VHTLPMLAMRKSLPYTLTRLCVIPI